MMPSLSVIVCATHGPEDLSVCLRSLEQQHYGPTEILVVDVDPEDTGKRLLVQRRFPECLYVSETLKGMAGARNRGLYDSIGEIIAYVDDNCRPVAGWSRAVVRNFQQMPRLGCCTGPVLPLELKTRPQRLLEERGGFRKGFARRLFTRNSPFYLSGSFPPQGRRIGTGANMAFRRCVLSRIGGFDPTLRTAEDIEIFFRVVKADYEVLYEPKAVVFHRHPRTYGELRRTLHFMGHGHIRSMLKIAHADPRYRKKALSEASAWFWSFQIRDRLFGRFRGRSPRFPLGLILAELAGGARALAEYVFHPSGPETSSGPPQQRFFSPFIRLLRRWT